MSDGRSGGQTRRGNAFDRLIEDDHGNIVRIILLPSKEWVRIPGTRVGLIPILIGRVEGHRHTCGSLIAVDRDQRLYVKFFPLTFLGISILWKLVYPEFKNLPSKLYRLFGFLSR